MPRHTIHDCTLIQLPKVPDARGNLTFIESDRQIPFAIKRVFYLYDVPGGTERGGHALKTQHQLIIAISGSFDFIIDDGKEKKTVSLNRSYTGLLVKPYIWRELANFSSGAVCLVLASDNYDEADYIRSHDDYLRAVNA